jgi:putative transposase
MTTETTSSYGSLTHSKWDCKYHVVFIPKFRKKQLFGQIRTYLGPVFRELSRQKECEIIEGKTMPDHVHMLIKIPPKYSVAEVIGYIKGKSAIAVARQFHGKKRNFNGEKLWARGYAVSTVGYEEAQVRAYIKNQEKLDAQNEHLDVQHEEEGSF